jgi:outer membrane receptor protein involved in Fe transport
VEEIMSTKPNGACRPLGAGRLLPLLFACLAAAAMLLPAATADADGRVAGAVLNGLTGQPVPGVAMTLKDTEVAAKTDPDGLFRAAAPAGTWTAVLSKDGFETQEVTDVLVTDGEVTDFSVVLIPTAGSDAAKESAAFRESITVAAEAESSTEAALLTQRRQAAQISDAIGAEEMSKNTGSDAAGALKRVTGISLQDNKYVYVRGLGDRYSNSTLNGSKLPSTEFERKVVPLDLFSADLLEKITVSKSYTVDKPGDFAAGFVDMETLQFPADQVFSVGLGVGYNSLTTGETFNSYGGGLSFSGGGGQPLPSGIPSDDLIRFSRFSGTGYTSDELEAYGEQLIGQWSPRTNQQAPYDQDYKLAYGNTFGRFGLVLSGSYDHSYSNRQETDNIFSLAGAGGGGGVEALNTYDLDLSEEEVRQSLLANLSYRLGDNHQIELRSLYTDVATSEGRFTQGFFGDLNSNIRDQRISYLDQEVLNVQLSGEHYFPGAFASGSLFEWRASQSNAKTNENRRQVLYEEQEPGVYELTDNANSGFMYFNDLEDDLLDAGFDWTTFLGGRVVGSLKLGGAYTHNERAFDGRRLRFFHRNTFGLDLTLPPEELFTAENIGPRGFEVQEITRPTDTYDGDQEVTAGYAQADLGFGRWRFIGGLRFEDSQIDLTTLDRNNPQFTPVVTEVDDSDVLPALAVVYKLTDRQNLRAAFSQTVNRPEFRELAPFNFVHIAGGYAVTGNPDLVSADIFSYDLRWEWFPSADEVVAASLFYKSFDRPIEQVLIAGAENLQSFVNAESAENYGVELELRRNLGSLWRPLARWTAVVNYTWVDSEISIDPEKTSATNPTRPLVGQPDSVANFVLEWVQPTWGSTARLLYNYVGEKVAFGGQLGLPDVLEQPWGTLDLVVRQDLGAWVPGLDVKLSASNLLDETREWTQANGVFRAYEPGVSYGLSLGFRPF